MKFKIDGYEYEDYQLSNEQILSLLKRTILTDAEREFLMKKVLDRFENECCARPGENGKDELFARQFSDYVNRCPNFDVATSAMARDHRHLQQEMFKVCTQYMKKLAEAYKKGWYDPRNDWACKAANEAVEHLIEKRLL